MTGSNREQQLLKASLYGVVFFVILAIVFAVLSRSYAILFDGVYSLISFCMVLLTLWVAKLAERPDDEQFHFGYSAIEPTLNLFKSLIIITVCIFAITGAVERLIAGGSPSQYGYAVLYGLIATIGCLLISALLHRGGKETRSELVGLEAKTWLVDGVLSGAVLAGFVIAWVLERSPQREYAQLVDPVLLIFIVLAVLPVPFGVVISSFREVISMAPKLDCVQDIEAVLTKQFEGPDIEDHDFRVIKQGRAYYVLIHAIVSDAFRINDIAELDMIREKTEQALTSVVPNLKMDMLFVKDPALAN